MHPCDRINSSRGEQAEKTERMRKQEESYDFILREKHMFGSGEYDFQAIDPNKAYAEYEETGKRLQQLKEHGIQRQVSSGFGPGGRFSNPCMGEQAHESMALSHTHPHMSSQRIASVMRACSHSPI